MTGTLTARWSWLLGLILPSLLAAAGEASAFTVQRSEQGKLIRWPAATVEYLVDGELPGISATDFLLAVRGGVEVWNLVGGDHPRTVYAGAAPGAQPGYARGEGAPNDNLVTVIHSGWTNDPRASALTITTYEVETGRLLDADILINAEDFAWSTDGSPRMDLQATVAHEAGHLFGLGHSAQVTEATMFPTTRVGEQHKRTLHPDDEAGLLALYGAPQDGEFPPDPDAGTVPGQVPGGTPLRQEGTTEVQLHCALVGPGASAPLAGPVLVLLLLGGGLGVLRRRRP